jgi:hypothetical protein
VTSTVAKFLLMRGWMFAARPGPAERLPGGVPEPSPDRLSLG